VSPIYQRGPRYLPIYIGLGDIIAMAIILEYFLLHSIHINKFKKSFSNKYILIPFILFVISAFISIVFSPLEIPTLGPFLRFSSVILICIIFVLSFNGNEDYYMVVKSMASIFFIHILSLLLDYVFSDQSISMLDSFGLTSENLRFSSSNVTVIVMMLSLPFIYMYKPLNKKLFFIVIFPIAIVITLFSLSRMGYLALLLDGLIIVVMLYARPGNKYKLISISILLLLTSVFMPMYYLYREYIEPTRESSNVERLVAAESAFYGFQQYPYTGIGYGQWIRLHELGIGNDINEFVVSRTDEDIIGSRNPHNTLLRIGLDMGFIGVIAFLILMIQYIKTGIMTYKKYKTTYSADCLCVIILLSNLIIGMMFGDYLDQNQYWAVNAFLSIVNLNKL
jgi:O-antigen ligase